jgi:hypothetical protein
VYSRCRPGRFAVVARGRYLSETGQDMPFDATQTGDISLHHMFLNIIFPAPRIIRCIGSTGQGEKKVFCG